MDNSGIIKKISGAVLLLISILLPGFTLNTIKPGIGFGVLSIVTIAVIALIALSIFIIRWMNKGSILFKIIGYVIFFGLAALPGFAMMSIDKSYNALGTAYYNAVIISILAWWGIFLFTRKPSDH